MEKSGTIIRSIEEITISAKLNMQDMIGKAMALGRDFADAKEVLGHGKFLPWLEKLGVSSSTANNYMRIAREILPGSRMSELPYSKALALLAAPAEDREALAAQAEDKSTAEIRKLIEERNRAAEAANTESARADQAEKDAKQFYQDNARLRGEIKSLEYTLEQKEEEMQRLLRQCDEEAREEEREKLQEQIADLRGKLLFAENNRIEVPPADYEQLKRDQRDLMEAAAQAEERAANMEAELEALRNRSGEVPNAAKTLRVAVTAFLSDCQLMPAQPETLKREQKKIEGSVKLLESWCAAMREALRHVIESDGAVVIE